MLIGIIILSLTLILPPTVQIVAAKKGEEQTVSFTGDLNGGDTLTVDARGINLAVYTRALGIELFFSDTFTDGDYNFEGPHDCKLRITIKGGVQACEAYMGCDFDPYYNTDVNALVRRYHLEGSGTTSSVAGGYSISLDASIYEVVPHRKSKKGAIGLEFVEPPAWEGAINFDMTI